MAYFLILVGLLAASFSRPVQAAALDSFEISLSTNRLAAGDSISVTIRPVGDDPNVVTNFSEKLPLQLFKRTPPTVVISELDPTNRVIELMNPTAAPLEISGWDLLVTDNSEIQLHVRFPENTVIPFGSLILVSKDPLTNPAAPVFYPETPARNWLGAIYTLRDRNGLVVDQVLAGITPSASAELTWKGASLPNRGPWSRIGSVNHFNTNDWINTNVTRGLANPGLTFPWLGGDALHQTILVQFTNGLWSGNLPVDLPDGSAYFAISDDTNHRGESARFEIESLPSIVLSFDAAALAAAEASPGAIGNGLVTLADNALTDTTVTLRSGDPSEFSVPSSVTIPAGQSSKSFVVTNLDDAFPDGAASVTITASASGYASTTVSLINRDNEVGKLFLVLPVSAYEDSGFQNTPGRVFIATPAKNDVVVKLRSDPILHVPSSVIIKAGQSSATFLISVGNDNAYSPIFRPRIWASTENWPETQASFPINDNDSSLYRLTAPEIIWEGETNEAVVTFNSPRHKDILVWVGLNDGSLAIGPKQILPAGQTVLRFPIAYNASSDRARIYAATEENTYTELLSIYPRPATPAITQMLVNFPRYVAFSGRPLRVEATLANGGGLPQYTNVAGELRLIGASASAPFTPRAIQFTNGFWAGDIVLEGYGLSVAFEVEAAGFKGRGFTFDLVKGGLRAMNVLDLAWHSRSNQFVVSRGPATNAVGELLAFSSADPTNILKALALPAPATSLSISDDGSTAWLILANRTFQKVDLTQWTLGQSFPVSTNTDWVARDILSLPGSNDRFVAVVGPSSVSPPLARLQLFENGIGNTNLAQFPNLGGPLATIDLVRGRDGSEFFLQAAWLLVRYRLADGPIHAGEISMDGSTHNLVFESGLLYNGAGYVIDPETLTATLRFNYPQHNSTHIFPFPALNRAFAIYHRSILVFELNTGAQLASSSIEHLFPTFGFYKPIAWTEGFAFGGPDGFLAFKTPFIEPTSPDLQLVFLGPTLHTNKLQVVSEPFHWGFEITNHGPGPAPATTLRLQGLGDIIVGGLQPGETRRVLGPQLRADGGIIQGAATLFSALPDSNPANNSTNVLTEIHSALTLTSGLEIPMTATALISSSNLNRLYVAYTVLPGHPGRGLAVINPNTGAVERTFPSTNTVTKLRTADDRYLFGITGPSEVTRWNLESGAVDAVITTPTNVMDIAAAQNLPGVVVVATASSVAAYQGETRLDAVLNLTSDFKCLGYAGSNLWLSTRGQLRRLNILPTGVGVAQGPIAISLFTDNYAFVADSQNLYFDSYVFRIASRTVTPGVASGGFLPFPERNILVSLLGNRAYAVNPTNMQAIAEDLLPFGPFGDSARFNETGVAVISGQQQLVLYTLSAVPLNVPAADLQLTVAPPALPYSWLPIVWTFSAMNNSSETARNVRIIVDRPDSLRDPVWTGAPSFTVWYSTAYELGDIPPNESKSVTMEGYIMGGNSTIAARVVSNSPDSNPANNTFSQTIYFAPPPADLKMLSLIGPESIALNAETTYEFVGQNLGPSALPEVYLALFLGEGLELPDGAPGPLSFGVGETKSFFVKIKPTIPGLVRVGAQLSANNSDPNYLDARQSRLVYVSSPGAPISSLTVPPGPPPRLLTWSPARQEIIAAFEDAEWAVVGLDPTTIQIKWKVPVQGNPQQIFPTSDGNYVWVQLGGGFINRVDIETKTVDQSFPVYSEQSPITAITSPPGRPEIVLVCFDPGWHGQPRVQAFENGVALPDVVAGNVGFVITESGRIFVYAPGRLREISLTASGVSEIDNFDSLASFENAHIASLGQKLYYSDGKTVDLASRTSQLAQVQGYAVAVDPTTRRITRAIRSNGIVPEFVAIEFLDSDEQVLWRAGAADFAGLLPMGTNGVLYLTYRLRLLKPDLAQRGSDLAVSATIPETVPAPNVPFQLSMAVTNRSAWVAENASFTVELPPGTSVSDGANWIPTSRWIIPAGSLSGSLATNLTLKIDHPGIAAFTIIATSDLPELSPADNQLSLQTTVSPYPILLLDNIALAEGLAIQAWLSSPAPAELNIPWQAAPFAATADDIAAVSGTFHFAAGSTVSSAGIISGDGTPELSESALVTLTSDTVSLIRTQIVVTILNDDFPRLTMTTPGSITEGNTNTKIVSIACALAGPAPFASEVEYQTVSGSAIAGRDFVAKSGRLRFAAGETSKTITVEIIGNTIFEPNKTFTVALKNPDALFFTAPTSAVTVTIRNDDPPPPFPMALSLPNGTSLRFNFQAVPNVTYQLETRTNLSIGNWSMVLGAPTIAGTNGQFTVNRPSPTTRPNNYYRIRATPN